MREAEQPRRGKRFGREESARVSVTALSANSRRVIEEAYDIAQQADQNWTTAHLLLAFFVVPNSAERLLTDRGLNEEGLLRNWMQWNRNV